jgi:hypothetical protein
VAAHRSLAKLVLIATIAGCSGQSSPDNASDGRVAERFRLDLDEDGITDDLVLWKLSSPSEPGIYRQLDLNLSRSGRHKVDGSWDPPRPSGFPLNGNILDSEAIFVGRFEGGGILLFMFG